MRDREHSIRDREHSIVKASRVVVALSLISSSCSTAFGGDKTLPVSATPTTPRVVEYSPSPWTPVSTLTPSSLPLIQEPTKTFPVIPNHQATNVAAVEKSFAGEKVFLEHLQVDEVWSFKSLGVGEEYIVGVVRDEQGRIEMVIKNFNCEAEELRDRGELGEREEFFVGLATFKRWGVYKFLNELYATKVEDIGDIDVIVSNAFSFKEGDGLTICDEYSANERVEDLFRRFLEFIRGLRN